MHKIRKTVIVTAALMLSGANAFAASPWPASIVGSWDMHANQSTLVLAIVKQKHVSGCDNISGTLTDTGVETQIIGFYCRDSGRIGFLRNEEDSGLTVQAYTGNLSVAGTPAFMAGQFAEETGHIGAPGGEFDFFAVERATAPAH